MAKVVYNGCYGGFDLSAKAVSLLKELGSEWADGYEYRNIPRHDANLVRVVEQLGAEEAGGKFSELMICELPEGTLYRIDEYDGNETVITQYDDFVAAVNVPTSRSKK